MLNRIHWLRASTCYDQKYLFTETHNCIQYICVILRACVFLVVHVGWLLDSKNLKEWESEFKSSAWMCPALKDAEKMMGNDRRWLEMLIIEYTQSHSFSSFAAAHPLLFNHAHKQIPIWICFPLCLFTNFTCNRVWWACLLLEQVKFSTGVLWHHRGETKVKIISIHFINVDPNWV